MIGIRIQLHLVTQYCTNICPIMTALSTSRILGCYTTIILVAKSNVANYDLFTILKQLTQPKIYDKYTVFCKRFKYKLMIFAVLFFFAY